MKKKLEEIKVGKAVPTIEIKQKKNKQLCTKVDFILFIAQALNKTNTSLLLHLCQVQWNGISHFITLLPHFVTLSPL